MYAHRARRSSAIISSGLTSSARRPYPTTPSTIATIADAAARRRGGVEDRLDAALAAQLLRVAQPIRTFGGRRGLREGMGSHAGRKRGQRGRTAPEMSRRVLTTRPNGLILVK